MDFVAGIRHNQWVYVTYNLDIDGGDMYVTVELKDNDGILHVITGQVQWDE